MTSRLYPVARYADPRAAIRFFERAFGFAVRAVFDAPDGGVAHAELTFGTGTIGLSSVGPVDPSNIWTTVRDGIYARTFRHYGPTDDFLRENLARTGPNANPSREQTAAFMAMWDKLLASMSAVRPPEAAPYAHDRFLKVPR